MKTLTPTMPARLALPAGSLAWCVTFTRRDGAVLRFASGLDAVTIGGNLYAADPGFVVSNLVATLGLVVDTAEMTVLLDANFAKVDFLAGRWDNCRVQFAQYDWADPAAGLIPWPAYEVADTRPLIGAYVLELRDTIGRWRQDYTVATSRSCPWRFGDGRCKKPLAGVTFATTVTAVASRSQFTCGSLAQAADYFTEGEAVFTTGLHAGLPLFVRAHAAGGVLTLAVPLLADIGVGQAVTVTAGCMKRRADCVAHGNILHFGGFGADAPTTSQLAG